jgi:hypothetical protein
LYPVLAEQPQAGFVCLSNSFRRMSFAHRHQLDFLEIATRTHCRTMHPFSYVSDVFGNGHGKKTKARRQIAEEETCPTSAFKLLTSAFLLTTSST